jgi:selenide,water dikinase
MAAASGVAIEFVVSALPILPGAQTLALENMPGGTRTNQEHFASRVAIATGVDASVQAILFDPQTSGGLLIAVASAALDDLQQQLAVEGVTGAVVGRVTRARDVLVSVA